jgi:hypothetical protein
MTANKVIVYVNGFLTGSSWALFGNEIARDWTLIIPPLLITAAYIMEVLLYRRIYGGVA